MDIFFEVATHDKLAGVRHMPARGGAIGLLPA